MGVDRLHLTEKVSRHVVNSQTKEVLDLRKRDQNGDTVCEADHNGDWNKPNEVADFQ